MSQSLIERFYMTSRPPFWISKQSKDGDFSVPNRSFGIWTWLSFVPINLELVSLRNDAGVCETSAKIPYWWRVASQIWLVLLIGCATWETCFHQSEALSRSGYIVWNFCACSSEVISRWKQCWYHGMSAVFSGIAAGHVKENAPYGSVIVIWMF